jgi:hypothetical protein
MSFKKLGVLAPLVVGGVMSLPMPAEAVFLGLNVGDQITFSSSVQINAAGFPGDFSDQNGVTKPTYFDTPLPAVPGELNGGADGFIDFLFGIDFVQEALLGISPNGRDTLSDGSTVAENRVLNYPIEAGPIPLTVGGIPIGYAAGATMDARADNSNSPSGGDGSATLGTGLAGANDFNVGGTETVYLTSVDGVSGSQLDEANGVDGFFATTTDMDGNLLQFAITELVDFCYNPGGDGSSFIFATSDTCSTAEGTYNIDAIGFVKVTDGMSGDVSIFQGDWNLAATGLFDDGSGKNADGTGGDSFATDGVTKVTTQAFSFRVATTPEPSSGLALLGVIGAGFMVSKRKNI